MLWKLPSSQREAFGGTNFDSVLVRLDELCHFLKRYIGVLRNETVSGLAFATWFSYMRLSDARSGTDNPHPMKTGVVHR